jgi:pyruvate-ferredoxin/flavodoxin oxidoreductase
MTTSMSHQKQAVKSGYWPLYRYKPTVEEHEHPFKLDSAAPSIPLRDFALKEARYAILARTDPERSNTLLDLAQIGIDERWHYFEQLASMERSLPAIPHPDEIVRVKISQSDERATERKTDTTEGSPDDD